MGGRGGGGQGGHKQIVTCYSLLIAKVRKVFKKNKTASLKQIQEEKKKCREGLWGARGFRGELRRRVKVLKRPMGLKNRLQSGPPGCSLEGKLHQ